MEKVCIDEKLSCGDRRLPFQSGFSSPYPISIAPMMDRTDRFFRWMLRQISSNTLLYSEMVSTGAVVHGDRQRHLDFLPAERPLALQLGGSDESELAEAVKIAEDWPYDEINLNVGCPSDRVQHRGLGACLMATPEKVASLISVMRQNTKKPVTIKHRIGINGRESWDELCDFVRIVARAGLERLTVHARIAILEGLSPKENRSVPPLRYDVVYDLKKAFPQLEIEINGHIDSVPAVQQHLQQVDAVMIGRAAYDNPYLFADIEQEVFGTAPGLIPDRREVVERCAEYFAENWQDGMPRAPLGHCMGLVHGLAGARRWRGFISQSLAKKEHPAEILQRSLAFMPKR